MINFENGTLVKGAYVVIDGVEHEVHMPQYSGNTPLSPEILNKMQADLQKEVDDIELALKGTTLYDNSIGTAGGITFSEEIQQGDSVEIVYCRRKASDGTSIVKTTGKLPFVTGMTVNLDMNYFSNAENQQSISKSITINNNGITVNGENTWGNAVGFNSTSTIYILKVKKYGE